MWFIYALLATLLWGTADLFYKKGADEEDKFSHLKTTFFVGVVFGIHAIGTLIFKDVGYNPVNLLCYLPVSLMYIISMVFGYFGLRYLELSVSSPIQNSSGAVSAILLFLVLGETMDMGTLFSVIIICVGVFMLGYFEKKEIDLYQKEYDKKYKIGFKAFMMPILYCVIDSLGTFFDGYYLDDISSTPLVGVTESTFEDVANISYELTFFIVAILIFIYIKGIKREKFDISGYKQKDRLFAAIFETLGQAFYVYAMSGNAVVAAPLIGSYCFVSLILSRIFLKEKLSAKKYVSIAIVVIGIVIMGIIEGLSA